MRQGQIVKRLREERGWTQDDLRERMLAHGRSMSRPNISLMESRQWLDGELLHILSRVFGVSSDTFFEGVESNIENREDLIDAAFEVIKRDPQFQFGAVGMDKASAETKLAIIRLYEKATGKKLVSDEVV